MRRVWHFVVLVAGVFGIASAALAKPSAPTSLLIRGGMVFDGLGNPPIEADVRLKGNRVIAIGKLATLAGEEVLDAFGLYVTPGFIDAHSHADGKIFDEPTAESQVRQGITCSVVGQDGGGRMPVREFFAKLTMQPGAIHYAAFSGHGRIREAIMGENYKRLATPDEIKKMEKLIDDDMKAGALGLSSGLEYDPGYYSDTNEVIALAKIAAKYGGMYISHVRDEGHKALKAFEELIQIAKVARLPAQISHIKLAVASVWGKVPEVIRLMDEANKKGLSITADVYPYTYWQSTIAVLSASRDWANRKIWEEALADVGGPQNVLLSDYSHEPTWVGKNLAEISAMTGKDAPTLIQEILEKTEGPNGKGYQHIVCTAMKEDDVRAFISNPRIMFCSDGAIGGSHPRGAGTYPRILGKYVRQESVLSWQEAIRKMTSLPAKRFGFKDRGILKKGMFADIAVFDPNTVIDRSTPQDPKAFSVGMRHVLVDGVPVLRDGKITGLRPGKPFRRETRLGKM